MARIPDEFLDCVFYLYLSRSDAEAGVGLGGTGFFVGIDWGTNDQRRHVYAVTNKHNIAVCRCSAVIRATTVDGQTYFRETDPVEWHPSPTDDISVLPIDPALAASFQNVSDGRFVKPADFENSAGTGLGPGDKVFMIGRFISHDGRTKNHPSARFGNISMTAAPIPHPDGYQQESFAVDMRSISGYSGSPAFAYWEFGGVNLHGIEGRPFHESFLGLLGIDWGHIPLPLPVLDKDGKPHSDRLHVKSHTSMSGVVPAWKLRDLLNSARFKEQRMDDEKKERKRLASEPTAEADVAGGEEISRPATDENPKHREDFTSLVGAAARKRQLGGKT